MKYLDKYDWYVNSDQVHTQPAVSIIYLDKYDWYANSDQVHMQSAVSINAKGKHHVEEEEM